MLPDELLREKDARRARARIDRQRLAKKAYRVVVRRGDRGTVELIEQRRPQLRQAFAGGGRRAGTGCDAAIEVVRLARPFLGDGNLGSVDLDRGVAMAHEQTFHDRPRDVGLAAP